MAGAATSDDESGTRVPRGSVRKWTAVAFAFTATLAVAAMLVKWQLDRRRDEIRTQFAMSAARVGRAIELKYQSHREVVNNITNVLHLAETEARGSLLEVEGAKIKTELNQQLAGAADTLKKQLDSAKAEESQAAAKATAAWNDAFTAVDSCLENVRLSTDAQNKVADSARNLSAAQAQFDLARAAIDTAQPPPTTDPTRQATAPPPSETPPNGDVAPAQKTSAPSSAMNEPSSLGLLREQLASATKALGDAKLAAEAADRRLVEECDKAGDGKLAIQASAEAEAAASRVATASSRARGAAARPAPSTKAKLIDSTGVTNARGALKKRVSELRSPTELVATGMKRHLPPSYAAEIDYCVHQPADVELCVANAIAKINGSRALIDRCPTQPNGKRIDSPTLTLDGTAVAIPSSGSYEHLVCARVPLDDLLAMPPDASARTAELETASDGKFDVALLLTSGGVVLRGLEGGQSHLRIAQFPELKSRQSSVSSVAENVEIGPDKYRVFFQPVRIALGVGTGPSADTQPAQGERHDVVVAGLVRETRLVAAETQISLISYLWVVLLLAFGLLGLPLAKLWFLGTRSSFGRFDVTLLGASAILITLLAAVLTLGFIAHNRLARRMDVQLEAVANELGSRLGAMVNRHAKQLDAFLKEDRPRCEPSTTSQAIFAGDDRTHEVCEHVKLQHTVLGSERAFLTDLDGRQTVKYTTGEHTTTPLSVTFRGYFQRAHAEEPVCLRAGGCSLRVVPEVVRSATSGNWVLIVARNVDAKRAVAEGLKVPNGSHVAGLEAELPLTNLVLPLGFQAAVINEDGTAMVHSDSDARFGQTVFDDVDDPAGLRAAMASNVPDTLNLRYLGIPSRLTVRPLNLEGTRWFSLAVAPRSLVDMTAVNMGLSTLVGYGAVLLGVVLLGFLFVLGTATLPWLLGWRGQPGGTKPESLRQGPSLRPNARFASDYARAGLLAVRASLITSVLSLVWFRWSVIWLLATLLIGAWVLMELPGLGLNGPLAHVNARLVRLRHGLVRLLRADGMAKPAGNEPSAKPRLSVSYPMALAGLVGILVVAPSVTLFASAYDYHAECAVRAEQHHYLQALRLKPGCLTSTAAEGCQNVIRTGTQAQVRPTNASETDDAVAFWLNPLPLLARQVPLLGSQVPSMLSAAGVTEVTGNLFSFARRPRAVAVRDGAGKAMFEVAIPPLLTTEYNAGHLAWALFAYVTALGVGWVTSACTLRRLFFLKPLADAREATKTRANWLLDVQDWDSRRLILLIHPSKDWLDELETEPDRHVDFMTLGTSDLGTQKPGSVWILRNLEERLDDPNLAQRIATAAQNARRFVILSDVEPLRRAKPELIDAWTRALYAFREHEAAPLVASELLFPSTAAMTAWWQSCDEDERRVLSQLALEGYTNPHPANFPAIRHLAGRGLLRPDKLTISSSAFADFVKHKTSPDDTRRWEESGEGTVWQSIRVPLSTGVATLLGALAFSKPELGFASALVPLATVSLPSILKILAATISKS
jgi:hypothetical protein